MKVKMNLLAAAAAAVLAVGSANANLVGSTQQGGNSSVVFVAMDNNATISLTVDLVAQMSSFMSVAGGNLSAAGTVAQWNLATNTYTVNGTAVAGNTINWASPVSSFFSNGAVTSAGYQWGVFAGDAINGAASGSNVVAGQNLLFTSAAPSFDNSLATGITSGTVANAVGYISTYNLAQNGTGTNTTTVKGAATSTGGDAFLGTVLYGSSTPVGDFGGGDNFAGMNFLSDPGATAYFLWVKSLPPAGAVTFSLGAPDSQGSLNTASAGFFTWNESTTTLTYTVPAVPEPGTYALMAAGLAAFGFIARRRQLRG